MNKKNVFFALGIILVFVIIALFDSQNPNSNLFSAKGGLNLKDANRKETNVNVCVEANQTTKQTLVQGLIIANHRQGYNRLYVGGSAVGLVSNEFDIMAAVLCFYAGLDLNNCQIEYKVGKFKRSGLTSVGLDPQYSNFYICLGEGAAAQNAMEISLMTENNFKLGFGHQGIESFHKLETGSWYVYSVAPICSWITLTGGFDINANAPTTGYVAAKATTKNNTLVLTGNKLGTEDENLILTYNRKNISILSKKVQMSLSAWIQNSNKGIHFVTGIPQGKGMLFAQVGSKYVDNKFTPEIGVGARYNF